VGVASGDALGEAMLPVRDWECPSISAVTARLRPGGPPTVASELPLTNTRIESATPPTAMRDSAPIRPRRVREEPPSSYDAEPAEDPV
jgi:hypothetical protein